MNMTRFSFSLASISSFVLLGVALFSSCSSNPQNPLRSLDTRGKAPKPTARMAARSGESLDQIGTGYWIFQRKCLECHESRVPRDPSHADWHPVMQGMSWNAGLSESEQNSVMAYLRAAAR